MVATGFALVVDVWPSQLNPGYGVDLDTSSTWSAASQSAAV